MTATSNNDANSNDRTSSAIRVITNDDILRSSRRLDRFLSLLNEDEATLLAGYKAAERVQVSTAQWTKEKLIDMVYQNLAKVNIIIEDKGETLQIPKYSEEIIDITPKLAVFKPRPELTIYLSDLNPEILKKLYELDKKSRRAILSEKGRRLFKIFFPYYYNTIADLTLVKIER